VEQVSFLTDEFSTIEAHGTSATDTDEGNLSRDIEGGQGATCPRSGKRKFKEL
jgi:hypothetical protein